MYNRIARLEAIARSGLGQSRDPFDRLRYDELLELADTMRTEDSGEALYDLFQNPRGPQTPHTGVRGAAFRENRLLLVREPGGLWTLPGGFCDVHDSPAQSIAREIEEESGFNVRVSKLYGLYNRNSHPMTAHPEGLNFTMFYFLCEITGGSASIDMIETDEVDFFDEDDLPPLNLMKVTPEQIARAFAHYRNPALPTDFD